MKIRDIVPNPWNPNIMTHTTRMKLRAEMEQHGYIVPIVVRPASGGKWEIVDGEQRWRELLNAGIAEVDVVIAELDDAEARIATVNLNELRGTWDEQGLGRLVQEMRTGLSLGELAERLPFNTSRLHGLSVETDGLSSGLVQELALSPQPVKPKSERGDVYELGPHRLMCGDASSAEDVNDLMQGDLADMVFTDPPYGARYRVDKAPSGRTGAASRAKTRFPGIAGDALSPGDWENLISGFLDATYPALVPGGVYYVCIGNYYSGRLQRLLEEGGLHISTLIVWKKELLVFGRKDYNSMYELVAYAWKKDKAHQWYGGRKQTDIWEIARDSSKNYIHPTQKPVSLAVRAIENSSKPDGIVVDPFGGSGTTLIAAEHVGRRCYVMDIEPRNVDIIHTRFERFKKQIGGEE